MYHMVRENGTPACLTVTCDVEHPSVGTFFFRWKIVNNRLAQLEAAPNDTAKKALLHAMMKKEILKRVAEIQARPTVDTVDPGLDEEVDIPL